MYLKSNYDYKLNVFAVFIEVHKEYEWGVFINGVQEVHVLKVHVSQVNLVVNVIIFATQISRHFKSV